MAESKETWHNSCQVAQLHTVLLLVTDFLKFTCSILRYGNNNGLFLASNFVYTLATINNAERKNGVV